MIRFLGLKKKWSPNKKAITLAQSLGLETECRVPLQWSWLRTTSEAGLCLVALTWCFCDICPQPAWRLFASVGVNSSCRDFWNAPEKSEGHGFLRTKSGLQTVTQIDNKILVIAPFSDYFM